MKDNLSENERKELDKPEKLNLVCRKCNHRWFEMRLKGYCVRYNRKGNFLVNIHNRKDVKFFRCPECGERKKVGRLACDDKINIYKRVK